MRLSLSYLVAPAHIVALQKTIQAGTGFITAVLVTIFLSPEEQGYFFTMGSLLSSYTLLDLGLSSLLVQVSARYFSGLEWGKNGELGPVNTQKSNFLALVHWTVRWYTFAGFATLMLAPIGYAYFYFAKTTDHVAWQLPWVAIVLSIAISMPGIGFLAILEGTGRIKTTYALRIAHYILGALMAWALLLSGNGLFAQAMAPVAIALVVSYWVKTQYGLLIKACLHEESSFSWKRDLWPQHKRVAITWFSNYLFLHIPTPVVFYFVGAKAAGQMGLSMTVANVLGAISMSWVTAITPRLTTLVAQGKFVEGRALFRHGLLIALLLLLLGSFFFVGLAMLVQGNDFAMRILSPGQLALLLLVFAGFHIFNALSIYFRAFKKEPLAVPNLLATVAIFIGSCLMAQNYGVTGVIGIMASAYLILSIYVVMGFLKTNPNIS
ncbi:MAG: hypothetical protein WC029_10570 [Sulfuricella sp.]|jgi:O-antigen/teichoic acid export membrane protein